MTSKRKLKSLCELINCSNIEDCRSCVLEPRNIDKMSETERVEVGNAFAEALYRINKEFYGEKNG